MASKELIVSPRISEQTYQMSTDGIYVFNVGPEANKLQIKAAIQDQYDVTVEKINTTVVKGKSKASNRRGRRPIYGNRKNIKKAYVKLKKGDKIAVFEGIE